MPQLQVRKVPKDIHDWLKDQAHERRVSKDEFTREFIQWAVREANGKNLPDLFHRPERPEPDFVFGVPFTFIDLFAGIGGMRLGLEGAGGNCRFSCEWDKYAQKTYFDWFDEMPKGDIRELEYSRIPDHDILAAGFPCQPFSIAGVSKKKSLGRAHGFDDEKQGNLFYVLAEIIATKRPPVVLLENVKNLKTHDRGNTWRVVSETLDDLGYQVFNEIIDAANYVPQHRERIFIVCFDRSVFGDNVSFSFPEPSSENKPVLKDILDEEVPDKYTLSPKLWNYLQEYKEKHRKRGNGFGFGLADVEGISRTLSARYFKDGSEILIPQKGKNPRRLTPAEAQALMGFPPFKITVSDTQAYKQFGNAVVPAVVEAVGLQINKVLTKHLLESNGCLIKAPDATKESKAA